MHVSVYPSASVIVTHLKQTLPQALSANGCDMMLNGLDGEEEVKVAVEVCQKGGASRVKHHGADLSDPRQIKQLFECVRESWGRPPDILVNNAGRQDPLPIEVGEPP